MRRALPAALLAAALLAAGPVVPAGASGYRQAFRAEAVGPERRLPGETQEPAGARASASLRLGEAELAAERARLPPLDGPAVQSALAAERAAATAARRQAIDAAYRAATERFRHDLPDGIAVELARDGDRWHWSLTAPAAATTDLERATRRLETEVRAVEAAHAGTDDDDRILAARALGRFGYALDPMLAHRVRPDYAGLALAARPRLTSLARRLVQPVRAAGPRAEAAVLLRFVQAIPYDRLLADARDGGAGFLPPLNLLAANRGDCDSKVALLAALLAAVLPGRPSAALLLPDHAVLALALEPLPGERTFVLDGVPMVLLEAAGPALLPPGTVADDTRRLLDEAGVLSAVPIAAAG